MPHVTQKGQVTIPLPIRKMLNLKAGDDLRFVVRGEKVFLEKRKPAKEALQQFVGYLGHLKGIKTDKVIEQLRGNNDDLSH